MAEEQRESNKLDIDVSDALKGLKALRREANETVKALDELQSRLNRGIVVSSEDGKQKAVFNANGDGVTIKGGSLTINGDWKDFKGAKTLVQKKLYPEKQIFEAGLDMEQVFIKTFTSYSRYLVIEYEQWTANEPIFFGFIRYDKYIRKTKNKERKFGKAILDLGEFNKDTKEIMLDISVCPISGDSCNFKITGIYFQD